MAGNRNRSNPTLIAILLTLLAVLAYAGVGRLDFTNYDDPYYVTENPQVRAGITSQGVVWAVKDTHLANWHPLTWISHMLDCQLYGLNAAGHHVTSLVFHAVNGVLLFLLLRSLTGATWRSAFVSALFSLHPMHVESVAWISERKDVLSTFFGILALFAYGNYAGRQISREEQAPVVSAGKRTRLAWYFLSLALFALGLMSKPMLVTWPFVMLLLDYWPLGRLNAVYSPANGRSRSTWFTNTIPLLLEKMPFFVLSLASCIAAILTQHSARALAPLEEVSMQERLVGALVSYARYIVKLIWPSDMAAIYPYVHRWPAGWVLFSILLLATISALAIWKKRERPYLFVGWAWFLGTLVPVIGIVQIGNQSIADRYTYIPSIGLFLMIVWRLADWAGQRPTRLNLATGGGFVVLVCFGWVTFQQVQHWKNTETLFRHALSVTSGNFVAYNSLGFHYADLRQINEAKECFQAALSINPDCPFSWSGVGRVLADEGKYDEAITNCQTALKLAPNLAEPHGTIGFALMQQGKINEAIAEYSEALRLRPTYASAHYDLANALARHGQIEQARLHYVESIRLGIASADAHNNLAYILVRQQKPEQAVEEFKTAIRLKPNLWQARYGLGDLLVRQRRYREAIAEFSEALRTKPDVVEALNWLAWILATNPDSQLRNGGQAVIYAEESCKLTQYAQPRLLLTLAAAYAEAGHFPEAIGTAEKAENQAFAAGQTNLASRIAELLPPFRKGQPYRENSN